MVSWGLRLLRPPRGSAALRREPPLHRLRRIVLSHDREETERIERCTAACDFAKRSRSRKRCGGGLQREALEGGRSPRGTHPLRRRRRSRRGVRSCASQSHTRASESRRCGSYVEKRVDELQKRVHEARSWMSEARRWIYEAQKRVYEARKRGDESRKRGDEARRCIDEGQRCTSKRRSCVPSASRMRFCD
jgi:hypothetical protein